MAYIQACLEKGGYCTLRESFSFRKYKVKEEVVRVAAKNGVLLLTRAAQLYRCFIRLKCLLWQVVLKMQLCSLDINQCVP